MTCCGWSSRSRGGVEREASGVASAPRETIRASHFPRGAYAAPLANGPLLEALWLNRAGVAILPILHWLRLTAFPSRKQRFRKVLLMVQDTPIDLKVLLLEKEDCDAGTVQKLREGLAQGETQYRTLREVTQQIKKKVESTTGAVAKRWHLKLGIASFFLGHLGDAIEHLKQAEGALAAFYLGRALARPARLRRSPQGLREGRKGRLHGQPGPAQQAGIHRQKGELNEARKVLAQARRPASHNAEYHFQHASIVLAEGDRPSAIKSLERAVELDPGHTGALFQLGHANDLAGNDDEAIGFYERCLNHPPVHVGVLMNLGILYEDTDKYDKAVDCYRKILGADPNDEQARLFLKDAQASLDDVLQPRRRSCDNSRFSQVLEIPVTDFELSVRSRNCLKKMNIRTLGDLTRVSEQQLLASKNFGETSLQEIKEMLDVQGPAARPVAGGWRRHYEPRYRPQSPMSPSRNRRCSTSRSAT